MNIQQAATKLEAALKHLVPDAQFARYSRQDIEPSLKGHFGLTDDLYAWYLVSAPLDVEIPLVGNPLDLFDPLRLLERQLGYRWVNIGDEFISDWNLNWVVIASIGGDPLIAHVDQENTPISMDFHGCGVGNHSWSHPASLNFWMYSRNGAIRLQSTTVYEIC